MFKNKKTILITVVLVSGIATNIANADFTFGEPTNLGPAINTSGKETGPNISSDNLTLYFDSKRSGDWDIWVTTRETTDDPWQEAVNLGPPVNGPNLEQGPRISADGLSLYFASTRPGGSGDWDLWVTTRETTDGSWGEPENLGPTVNSSVLDHSPSISADGLSLFFGSTRSGGSGSADLWLTTRETIYDNWGTPVNLGPAVNSSANEGVSSISADGRMLFFSSFAFGPPRPGGYGNLDIWVATRATVSDPWAAPVNLGPMVNSSFSEGGPDISADGSTLYFNSDRPAGSGWGLWQVSIDPVVDLNADGIVDSADMCIMVDHWGTDNRLCDIGPMPWGDGVVDVEDLIVLSEHLFEEVPRQPGR